jgi:hypothetical protein
MPIGGSSVVLNSKNRTPSVRMMTVSRMGWLEDVLLRGAGVTVRFNRNRNTGTGTHYAWRRAGA